MQITSATIQYLFNTWDLRFQDAYKNTPEPWWTKVATQFDSSSEFQTYAWSSRVPRLREWIGDRAVKSIDAKGQSITNKHFELTIELERNKILDDTYGVFQYSVDDLARAAKKHPDVQVLTQLTGGQSIACWDGVNFFDTAHPVDRFTGQSDTVSTQQNYWSSGTALTFDNYQTVRSTMMQYVGEDNLPFGVMPNLLVVPPQLEVTARLIVESSYVAPQTLGAITQVGQNENPLKGTAEVLVIPELGGVSATTWYLLDTSRGIKPFGWQQRKAPEFVAITDPASESVFRRNKFTYGVDLRGAPLTTLWFLAAKAVG